MTLAVLANIDVDDLGRAADFYCAALELTVGRRFGNSAVELVGASCAIYLLEHAPGTAGTPASSQRRDYARHWTPVHLDFVVPKIDPAVARAQNAGARLEGEVRTHAWGRIAVLADPFGHGFCLIEFLGRGYDEIATQAQGEP
jgi:predicted enzyme related to lactoylglutathione lyase